MPSSSPPSPPAAEAARTSLRSRSQAGVYEYELTQQYLLDNGISELQAETESGKHTATLWSDGAFVDAWRTAENRTGSCRGTYEQGDGGLVTFRWA